MQKEHLTGVLVPVLTPFLPDLRPNTQAFVEHCHWLLDQGADGLAVFGTTSEANSLTMDERIDLLDALVESGIDAQKLMPGTGTCAAPDTIRLSRHALDHGCAGVLMLPPYYYKGVSDDGLFASFAQVIEGVGNADLKVYLYHIPPMSQVPISIPLVERLVSSYPSTIAGVKDSGGDWANTATLLSNFPQLSIFPGSEVFMLDALRLGGAGCITATGNINTLAIKELYERWQENNADELQASISTTRGIVQAYPMIPALKGLLANFYADPGWLLTRPPLCTLEKTLRTRLGDELREAGFCIPGSDRRVEEISAGSL